MTMKYLLTLLLVALPVAGTASPEAPVEAARDYREENGARILSDFARLLALPNVASDAEGIRANAAFIAGELGKRGAKMELLELPGAPPVVYGTLPASGAERTLGIYVHYDGQPVSEEEWTSGPWSPSLYTGAIADGGTRRELPSPGEPIDPEWRLYARSAGDDKAPVAALLAALDALETAGISRTSNLVFFFEGEEEAGSPHLGAYLETYADLLDVDGWLICDGPVHQSRKPQLVFGVRGVVGFEITVYGPVHGLHSGHYGNWAPNPALMLAQLLAGMKDADGNVTIPGFNDSVEPLGETERRALETVPVVDADLMAEFGLARTEGDGTLAERLLLPSLNIRGMASAGVGEKARNVVPPTATAALDIRLVKGNDPDAMVDLVERYIESRGYTIVREDPDMELRRSKPRLAKVVREGGYVAARTAMDQPLVKELIQAAERAAGEPVVLVPGLGGSLPLYLFTERWDCPMVIVPMANHDDNQHAPDENLRVANLWYGIDLMASILTMP